MTERPASEETAGPIRALLVDDHTLYRQGLRQALRAQGIDVVGEGSNGLAGVKLVSELKPDVVVMDLHMPMMGGIEATRTLIAEDPGARVVMLTVSEEEDEVLDALAAGACGYVLKDSSPEVVIEAVRAAHAGESNLSPRIASRLIERVREGRREGNAALPLPDTLTTRELEILRLLAKGKENTEIAAALMISPSTAKNHVAHVLDKLGLENRVQAAVYAVRAGLV
jgi:DNA-binding NarL/FixJ family response regulator